MRMILLSVAVVVSAAGCSSTPVAKSTPTDVPRTTKHLILTPQERAGRNIELSKDDVARTQVEGNLVR